MKESLCARMLQGQLQEVKVRYVKNLVQRPQMCLSAVIHEASDQGWDSLVSLCYNTQRDVTQDRDPLWFP